MARNKTVDELMKAVRNQDEKIAKPDDLKVASEALENDDDGPIVTAGVDAGAETPPGVPETPAPEAPAEPATPEAPAEPVAAKPETPETPEDIARTRQEIERQRKENARLRAQLASIQQQREQQTTQPAAQPAATPAAKVEEPPADPEPPKAGAEPNEAEFPLEHETWERKQLRHELWEQRQESRRQIDEIKEQVTGFSRQSEEQRLTTEFDAGVELQRQQYVAENPEFDQARAHLEGVVRRRMLRNGVPAHQLDGAVRTAERQFFVAQMNRARADMQTGLLPPDTNIAAYAFEMLIEEARDSGWNVTPAPAGGNGATRPAMTPSQKIADTAARASAGRSASNMRPAAVPLPEDGKMTFDRLAKMTPVERERYKKAHPKWEVELGLMDNPGNFFTDTR